MSKLVEQKNVGGEMKLVVTSRQVSESFNKRNSHVVEAIENKIKSLTAENSEVKVEKLFIPSTYIHNGNEYKEYLLTRDGFTFIVMGFTGAKADAWKLKYIEAFNKMEEELKGQALKTSELSPELQMFKQIFDTVAKQQLENKQMKEEIKETKEEIQGIRDIVAINLLREESYRILEERGRTRLSVKLTNKRRRMAEEGVCKSKRDKLNKLDVIADDNRLVETYIAIVKEMAIKYGISTNQ